LKSRPARSRVRAAVAAHPATPAAALERIAADDDSDVLAAMSARAGLPQHLADKVRSAREELARQAAARSAALRPHHRRRHRRAAGTSQAPMGAESSRRSC